MTQATLWGSLFIIFSMPLAIFWFVVRRSPKLVIVLVASAFMWLLAALLTGIIWIIIPPLQDDYWFVILISVPIQEAFRYFFWKMLHKAEKGLSTLTPDGDVVITREKLWFVSGLGFGVMSAVMMMSNMLDIMTGPGMVPARGCPDFNLFTISALVSAAIVMCHAFWGVIAGKAWEQRTISKSMFIPSRDWKLFFVLAMHYFVAFLTIDADKTTCVGFLLPIYGATLLCACTAWFVIRARFSSGDDAAQHRAQHAR
ncbi:hypothetical protein PTSG_00220 [Salpingoeca rosetta]|uniref:Aph-1 protein n=1 Tax=Salpingoeca rosetta (strain ATCC 50818 / BSB-021) TaxID=946362 RepID=F2TVV2_SALR5|nr:uncharacterized protein PTSG_00220 [Salpingoeca rosetta]EGD72198.1 hypothetical protein PTSG_00220 [Salpingoeca rosetta]|eukprot:XP_004998769.1 hypothetical protein PTSG_00220 [Salpingoeca rosetta]